MWPIATDVAYVVCVYLCLCVSVCVSVGVLQITSNFKDANDVLYLERRQADSADRPMH